MIGDIQRARRKNDTGNRADWLASLSIQKSVFNMKSVGIVAIDKGIDQKDNVQYRGRKFIKDSQIVFEKDNLLSE